MIMKLCRQMARGRISAHMEAKKFCYLGEFFFFLLFSNYTSLLLYLVIKSLKRHPYIVFFLILHLKKINKNLVRYIIVTLKK